MNKIFFRDFFVISLIFILINLFFYFIFLIIGEINLDKIVNTQFNNKKVLFSSGLRNDAFEYKSLLYKKSYPELIIVGSSRAMQVRESFFSKKMFNWGGTVSSLSKLDAVFSEILLKENKPKIVIIYLDFWWLNFKQASTTDTYSKQIFPNTPDFISIFKFLKIYSTEYTKINSVLFNKKDNRLGLFAVLKNEGFANDGSWYYSGRVVDNNILEANNDIGHQLKSYSKIDLIDKYSFLNGNDDDKILLNHLILLLRKIKSNSISPIVVLPPLGGEVVDYLYLNNWSSRVNDLKFIFETESIEFFDFTDISKLQPNDIIKSCEFIDDFHPGDVVNARLINKLSYMSKNNQFINSVNNNYLESFISHFSGYAEGDSSFRKGRPEANFRGIECH